MGRWMEILSKQPPKMAGWKERSDIRLGEIAPTPLMYAAQAIRGATEQHFPHLYRIRFDSSVYQDEELWLNADEAADVLEELRYLRKLCRREAFIPGLDGTVIYERWRKSQEPSSFEHHLNEVERLLDEAVQRRGGVLLLL